MIGKHLKTSSLATTSTEGLKGAGGRWVMTRESVASILVELGRRLGFRVGTEVQASDSAWVDVVWFDDRFDFGPRKGDGWSKVKTWRQPVLPVAGFEIEASVGAKPLKGSIANLNDLGAIMSVIVISEENIAKIRSKSAKWRDAQEKLIWAELSKRTVRWVYEARPIVRVVVMTEPEVKEWARNKGVI
jgi:hypothetical protein